MAYAAARTIESIEAELAPVVGMYLANRAALKIVQNDANRLDISMLSPRNQGVMQAYMSGTEDATSPHYRAAKATRDHLFTAYGSGDVLLKGQGK